MPPEWEKSFDSALRDGIRMRYPYVWGGYDPTKEIWDVKAKIWASGLDCSGFMYWAALRAGIPGVRRSDVSRMARGLDGWVGTDRLLGELAEMDLIINNHGKHIGAAIRDDDGLPGFAHAGSKGTQIVPLRGWVLDTAIKGRRLTIGDKK